MRAKRAEQNQRMDMCGAPPKLLPATHPSNTAGHGAPACLATLEPMLSRFLQESHHHPVRLWDSWRGGDLAPALRHVKVDLLRRGRSVLTLATPDSATEHESRRRLDELSRRGAEVRVRQDALPEMIILDRRVAVLRTPANRPDQQVTVIQDPTVVSTLSSFYTMTWHGAVHLERFHQVGLDRNDETTARILELLGGGCKDETAARKLRMSVRTYRRHVADLMQKLGAESRFQAGALAAQLDLVTDRCYDEDLFRTATANLTTS